MANINTYFKKKKRKIMNYRADVAVSRQNI